MLLVWRLRAGNAAALARIYEKHRHQLLRVASGLLRDAALAEDAVQDVFLRIARAPETIRADGNLRAFLCVCVANRARNVRRSVHAGTAGPTAELDELPDSGPGPVRCLIVHDALTALASALAELPEEQREAVVLHLQGDLSFREIASATGVSINTAHSRYRYGLERLRSLLKGEI